MSTYRKLLVALGAVLLLLVAAAVALPFLFKDRIAERVRAEIHEAVDAEVAWTGVRLGLLRSFPNLSFRLNGLTADGVDRFAGERLASMDEFRLVLDLGSVVRWLRRGDQIVIRSIELVDPVLSLRVLEDGTANWDIVKPAAEPPAAEPDADPPAFDIGLRRLEVRNAAIALDHAPAALNASLEGLDHTLRGNFTQELFDLHTRTRVREANVAFGGVRYLTRAELEADATLAADLANGRFTFKDNEVRLNDLRLTFQGEVATADEDLDLDLTFAAPRTDFRSILSLVPAIYAQDFADLRTEGAVRVDGHVRGRLGEDAFPSFALHAVVDDAMFQYPDLPLPARDIALDLNIQNPGGDMDSTVVRVERFRVTLGNDPVEAALVLRTPVSDPDIDFRLNGRVDLADLSRTVKLEGVDELSGRIAVELAVRTRLSYVEREEFDRVVASGNIAVNDLVLRSEALPHALAVEEATLRVSPQFAELASFRATVGSSDLALTGRLDNLLGFALRDQDLRGRATLTSGYFDLDEWRSDEDLEVIPVPARIDATLDATVARMTMDNLVMTDARGRLHLKDERLTLEGFRLNTLGGEITVSGYYETTTLEQPTFDVVLGIRDVQIVDAFDAFLTVRTLAPVARYARGSFSADLNMNGGLAPDLTPIFAALNGTGSIATSILTLQGFPPLHQLADRLQVEALRDPTLDAIRSSIVIRDGRLYSGPFDMRFGDFTARVAGWNGLDQSMDYGLALRLPRAALGQGATRVVDQLAERAGRLGLSFDPGDMVELAVQLTGSVTNPSISTDFGDVIRAAGAGAARQLQDAAGREVERRIQEAERAAAEAREAARLQAQAEADRIMREAEERVDRIRAEARQAADALRQEADRQAEALLARATDPIARAAARTAGDRMRREADANADRLVREADERADAIVAEARRRADALLAGHRPPS